MRNGVLSLNPLSLTCHTPYYFRTGDLEALKSLRKITFRVSFYFGAIKTLVLWDLGMVSR